MRLIRNSTSQRVFVAGIAVPVAGVADPPAVVVFAFKTLA
jgi:hypothetical protein